MALTSGDGGAPPPTNESMNDLSIFTTSTGNRSRWLNDE